MINNKKIDNWSIVPLEFKSKWVNNLEGFKDYKEPAGPGIYTTTLNITGDPSDTYIDTRGWGKGRT